MNVEVWTQRWVSDGIEAKRIWVGTMSDIPRLGESVCLTDGGVAEEIRAVCHNLHDGSVTLQIGPDVGNLYPEVDAP